MLWGGLTSKFHKNLIINTIAREWVNIFKKKAGFATLAA